MIDLANESLMSLSQAAAALPPGRRGTRTNPSTLFRWISKGVQTPAGNVRMEAIRLGGRWLTSWEALQRFAERQTPETSVPVAIPCSAAARRRASERAAQELARLGI